MKPRLPMVYFFFTALATFGFAGLAYGQTATVERNVNLRNDPSTSQPPIRLLKPPTILGLLDLDPSNGYYHVETANNEQGWVWGPNVRIDEDAAFDPSPAIPAYDRGDWRHWIDADGDCQNTRNEVLIRDSTIQVTFKPRADGRQCIVIAGRWIDPYSNEVITSPAALDIDHMVPLQNAHLSGGWDWDNDRRRDYANNLDDAHHLLAVKASLNRQKGAKGPEEWKPPTQSYWCTYATDWERIKTTWHLSMTTTEAAAVSAMEATCQ